MTNILNVECESTNACNIPLLILTCDLNSIEENGWNGKIKSIKLSNLEVHDLSNSI